MLAEPVFQADEEKDVFDERTCQNPLATLTTLPGFVRSKYRRQIC
jgi:hypothetical protein